MTITVDRRSTPRGAALARRPRPPARPPAPGRLVEGRARDQRHDRRRGPPAAPLPRHPRPRPRPPRAARWIRSQQRADGTWATFHGGPGDLSTTVEAYAALRLAGDPADAGHMVRGRRVRPRRGRHRGEPGVHPHLAGAVRRTGRGTTCRCCRRSMILLPPWFPLNVYDWACWARQTDRAADHRRARCGPGARCRSGSPSCAPGGARRPRRRSAGRRRSAAWTGCCTATSGVRSVRCGGARCAAPSAGSSPARRPTARGAGSSRPGSTRSSRCTCSGYGLDHPGASHAALAGLGRLHDRRRARAAALEACQSPVWDTALAMIALLDAGCRADHPALTPRRRLAAGRGDHRPAATGRCAGRGSPPAAGPFEFANDNYPDVDDTAEVVLALRRVAPTPTRGAADRRGVEWMLGMPCRDGGCGAFDADNTRTLARKLPFCDFGAVIDPPTRRRHRARAGDARRRGPGRRGPPRRGARVAAARAGGRRLVVRPLGRQPRLRHRRASSRPSSPPASDPAHPAIRAAVRWLERAPERRRRLGRGPALLPRPGAGSGAASPRASQTAWALLALLAGRRARRRGRARRRLAGRAPSGRTARWDEPHFTGTGFPGDFYINYHLYRLVFPVSALGRYPMADQ